MRFSAVFLDVDDVMLDMDRIAHLGVQSVVEPLRESIGPEAAERVQATFASLYDVLIERLRSPAGVTTDAFEALKKEIAGWQEGFVETKLFSRHVLMAIALQREGIAVTRAILHGAVDHYWQVLADATEVFEDARKAIQRLRVENTPFQLATNSDGFFEFDDAIGRFRYDPRDAVNKKLARLDSLREIGIPDRQITVGDPYGKPDPRFYEAAIDAFSAHHGAAPELARSLAAGDSLTSDVLPFLDKGVRLGAWVKRDHQGAPHFLDAYPNVLVVSKLTELWDVSWPV